MAPTLTACRLRILCCSQSRAAVDESDLSARQAVAAAAARSARLAPKETQEWCEAGWWKWDGAQAPPDIIPGERGGHGQCRNMYHCTDLVMCQRMC